MRRTHTAIEILAVVAIVILAAVLRLGWLGVNSFAFDEAHLSLIALDMARGGELARVGMPSSVGVPNLPAAAWIFSIPYLFSPDPLIATQFIGVLGVAAVVGVWWWSRRVWGRWAGLVAGLFMAASPFAVLYARSIWAQNLLPVWALAWGWTAMIGATRQSRVAVFAHVFLTGFIWQVHFAGAALILPTAYFFLRFRWWRHWLPGLLGGALAVLTLVPFISEMLCCRPDLIDQYTGALGGGAQIDLQSFAQVIQLGSGQDWNYLLAGDLQPAIAPVLPIAIGLILVAGLIAILWSLVHQQGASGNSHVEEGLRPSHTVHRTNAEILLAWLILPPLFFARHSTPVFIHYQLVTLPALALVAGASTTLWQSSSSQPKQTGGLNPLLIATVGLMILVTIGWALLLAQGFALAGTVETPNGLGTPLQYSRQAAHDLPDDVPVWFFTHGDDPNVDGEAAVFNALWWGRDHQIVPGVSLLILPDEPASLMATLRYIQAWEELEDAGLVDDEWTSPRREGALPFVATSYDGERDPAGFTLLDEPVQLADGTALLGWKARMVGPRLRISTLWAVIHAPDPGIYQQFHHLHTAPDSTEWLHQADVPIAAQHWRVGDRLIVMGDFFVDDLAEFWVDVGHYTLPTVQRVARADGSDGAIRIGPLMINPRLANE